MVCPSLEVTEQTNTSERQFRFASGLGSGPRSFPDLFSMVKTCLEAWKSLPFIWFSFSHCSLPPSLLLFATSFPLTVGIVLSSGTNSGATQLPVVLSPAPATQLPRFQLLTLQFLLLPSVVSASVSSLLFHKEEPPEFPPAIISTSYLNLMPTSLLATADRFPKPPPRSWLWR